MWKRIIYRPRSISVDEVFEIEYFPLPMKKLEMPFRDILVDGPISYVSIMDCPNIVQHTYTATSRYRINRRYVPSTYQAPQGSADMLRTSAVFYVLS